MAQWVEALVVKADGGRKKLIRPPSSLTSLQASLGMDTHRHCAHIQNKLM